MKKNNILTSSQRVLIRRYLIWCYKTTKEDLDRIDRYFTQLMVDRKMLASLRKAKMPSDSQTEYRKKVDDFAAYMKAKGEKVLNQKFAGLKTRRLNPDYWYLQERLQAVESAIKEFLGLKELKRIVVLYEEEMTRRILEAREHS